MKIARLMVAVLALAITAACSASPTGPVANESESCPVLGSGTC